jgi:putative MFS transporter
MAFSAIDEAPIRAFHRKLAAACSGGPLLDGYLLGIVGIALTGITAQWHLNATTAALVGVAALVGMFFGGLIFGPITDRIGRKPMYTLDLLALIIASLLSVFVTAAWQLIALRFVIGVAIAADYPIATSLLSEWLPRRQRGKIFTSIIIIWYIGTALAYFVGYLITATLGNGGWRWMLGSSAILAAVIFLLRLGTPESPRWLVQAGRTEEAREVIEHALDEPVAQADLENAAAPEGESRGSVTELFHGVYLRRMAFVVTFFTCAIIPLFALETFGPRLLGSFGLGSGNLANLGTAIINLVFAIGCLPAMWLLESVGRRKVIIWSFGLMVLPLVALGAWTHAPAPFAITFFRRPGHSGVGLSERAVPDAHPGRRGRHGRGPDPLRRGHRDLPGPDGPQLARHLGHHVRGRRDHLHRVPGLRRVGRGDAEPLPGGIRGERTGRGWPGPVRIRGA